MAQRGNNIDVAVRVRSDDTHGHQWSTGNIPQRLRQWFHLVVTWIERGNLTVYISGTNRKVVTYPPEQEWESPTVNSSMYIGARNHETGSLRGVGRVDELQMWDFVKTPQEVTMLFSGNYVLKIRDAKNVADV